MSQSISNMRRRFVTSLRGHCFLTALLLCPGIALAQDTATVTGIVIDGITEAPLANVRVSTMQETVVTGPDGRFSITLTDAETTLRFEADEYLESTLPAEGTNLEVLLFRYTFAETVNVEADAVELERPSTNPLASEEVLRVAGSIDNIFRALDTLPGVAATDDFTSRLAVRGGTPDQNLTVMDGIEIHNPYRLFGITSAFNPETVENFQLTAGGFGVAYGDRLSSLLIVDNRRGRRDLQGATALSITDGNIVLEGTTPIWNNGTWLFSARRTYYDLILDRILENQQLPAFTDLQMQTSWDFTPGHRLSLTSLRSVEDADLDFRINRDRPGEQADFGSDVRNDLASVRFDAVLGARSTSTTIASWYRNREFLDFDGRIRLDAKRSNTADDKLAFGLSTIIFNRLLSVRDLSLRHELTVQATPAHLLSTGFEVHRLRTGVKQTISGDRNSYEANGSSVEGGSGLPDSLDSSLTGTRSGFWIQESFTPSSRVSIEPGLRLDWNTVNDRRTLSPRMAASYSLNPSTRLRAAVGLYTQSPGYEKLIQSDYFIDLSAARQLRLLYEKATHVVVGIQQNLGNNLTARIEGYHKRFNDLLIGRLETEAQRLSRISQYDFPENLQQSIPRRPLITSDPSNDGGGDAHGFDILLNHTNPSAPLTGWLSYNWGRAFRNSYGRRYAFEYDRRHAFNAVGRYRITYKFEVAATARIATGFPHTTPTGLRIAAVENDLGRLVPETDLAGNQVYTVDYGNVDNLNNDRLPHYTRVDLRLTYQPGGLESRWSLYLEVINLLNRKNAIVLEPRLQHDPGSTLPRLTEVPTGGFPRIPTVGFRLHF